MFADWMSLQVIAVLFVATLIRSSFGFGEALVAVPLLSLIVPVEVAAPVAVLASICVAAIVVVQDWRHVHFHSARRLVLATLVGTPVGLLVLTTVPEAVVKRTLAAVIILFSTWCLLRRRYATLADDSLAWLFGFGAGVLGGAYGMNGPPLVVYGALRGWSPQHFRATLQGYFLPASSIAMAGYWLTGLWTSAVTRYFVISLPAIVTAVLLGRLVNQRMKGHRFLVVIHIALILIGGVLLVQSVKESANGRTPPALAASGIDDS
jgi:uncharacterized protein